MSRKQNNNLMQNLSPLNSDIAPKQHKWKIAFPLKTAKTFWSTSTDNKRSFKKTAKDIFMKDPRLYAPSLPEKYPEVSR